MSSTLQSTDSSTDNPSFPVKSQRVICWGARDQYLGCIDKMYGEDAPSTDVKGLCTSEAAEFERVCPKSWVQHFKQRREAFIRDRKLKLRPVKS